MAPGCVVPSRPDMYNHRVNATPSGVSFADLNQSLMMVIFIKHVHSLDLNGWGTLRTKLAVAKTAPSPELSPDRHFTRTVTAHQQHLF